MTESKELALIAQATLDIAASEAVNFLAPLLSVIHKITTDESQDLKYKLSKDLVVRLILLACLEFILNHDSKDKYSLKKGSLNTLLLATFIKSRLEAITASGAYKELLSASFFILRLNFEPKEWEELVKLSHSVVLHTLVYSAGGELVTPKIFGEILSACDISAYDSTPVSGSTNEPLFSALFSTYQAALQGLVENKGELALVVKELSAIFDIQDDDSSSYMILSRSA